jgi:hypothetical protein
MRSNMILGARVRPSAQEVISSTLTFSMAANRFLSPHSSMAVFTKSLSRLTAGSLIRRFFWFSTAKPLFLVIEKNLHYERV